MTPGTDHGPDQGLGRVNEPEAHWAELRRLMADENVFRFTPDADYEIRALLRIEAAARAVMASWDMPAKFPEREGRLVPSIRALRAVLEEPA